MPIQLDSNDEPPPARSGTSGDALLAVLLDHPDMGFTPDELAELTGIPRAGVREALVRLRERGLVREVDTHWAVAEDVAASHIASAVSREAIEATYGDDAYGADDDWAETVPDLGENA